MRAAFALLIGAIFVGTLQAQAPALKELPPAPPPSPSPAPVAKETVIVSDQAPIETVLASAPAVGQQHLFGVQLQFGTPTGIRGQYAIYRAADHSYLLEIFGGARSSFWGDEGVFGFGGRAMFNLASGRKNAMVFAPGLGLSYWQANDHYNNYYYSAYKPQTNRWFLNLDANIGWLHEMTPELGFEIGLNIGARIGLSGQNEGGGSVSGRTSGNIGLYTGLRY